MGFFKNLFNNIKVEIGKVGNADEEKSQPTYSQSQKEFSFDDEEKNQQAPAAENNNPNKEYIDYAVLVQQSEEGDGFFANDYVHDAFTKTYYTVQEALNEIKTEVEEVLQEIVNECGKLPNNEIGTEAALLKNRDIQKMIQRGEAKIKIIRVSYQKPFDANNDPDW